MQRVISVFDKEGLQAGYRFSQSIDEQMKQQQAQVGLFCVCIRALLLYIGSLLHMKQQQAQVKFNWNVLSIEWLYLGNILGLWRLRTCGAGGVQQSLPSPARNRNQGGPHSQKSLFVVAYIVDILVGWPLRMSVKQGGGGGGIPWGSLLAGAHSEKYPRVAFCTVSRLLHWVFRISRGPKFWKVFSSCILCSK